MRELSLCHTLGKLDQTFFKKYESYSRVKIFFSPGGIVLPLLGAVPDSAIIIVSGLGPDAQTKLSVGMG